MDLFQENIKLELPDADIVYYPNFLNLADANHYFEVLKASLDWQQDFITVFGKTHLQPRLTALFGNNGRPYSYSNIVMEPKSFTHELLVIKKAVEAKTQIEFTTCLANLYRNGKDSNGWHSDDEKELGDNPPIASISLGQPRFFHLKHKSLKNLKHKILLEHGSLLLMTGPTQHFWKHQIPKTAKPIGERINLTFRVIE